LELPIAIGRELELAPQDLEQIGQPLVSPVQRRQRRQRRHALVVALERALVGAARRIVIAETLFVDVADLAEQRRRARARRALGRVLAQLDGARPFAALAEEARER